MSSRRKTGILATYLQEHAHTHCIRDELFKMICIQSPINPLFIAEPDLL